MHGTSYSSEEYQVLKRRFCLKILHRAIISLYFSKKSVSVNEVQVQRPSHMAQSSYLKKQYLLSIIDLI